MPTPAFMRIEGSKQGLINQGAFTEASVGYIFVEGHEDEFIVQAFNHEIIIPRDPQSGHPTGRAGKIFFDDTERRCHRCSESPHKAIPPVFPAVFSFANYYPAAAERELSPQYNHCYKPHSTVLD